MWWLTLTRTMDSAKFLPFTRCFTFHCWNTHPFTAFICLFAGIIRIGTVTTYHAWFWRANRKIEERKSKFLVITCVLLSLFASIPSSAELWRKTLFGTCSVTLTDFGTSVKTLLTNWLWRRRLTVRIWRTVCYKRLSYFYFFKYFFLLGSKHLFFAEQNWSPGHEHSDGTWQVLFPSSSTSLQTFLLENVEQSELDSQVTVSYSQCKV